MGGFWPRPLANLCFVKYSGGETHLYTDRVVRLYDVESGSELKTLRGHTGQVVVATFSPGQLAAC